jgi:hypothetical protein
MADISYTPKFKHTDWIDGESIVQASGDNGMNIRFHGCEQEFAAIATTFGVVNTTVKNIQQLQFLTAQQNVSVQPTASSGEFDVETYDRTPLPANVDKTYFCLIFPVSGLNILHTFLYHPVPGNKVRVTIAFFNPTATAVSFGYRILALGGPSS